jgi:hypothetical protein
MATKLEIINYALAYLGNPPVNTLDLSNTVVQAMSSIYDQQLPDVLASHPWRFALKWAELIQDTSTPEDPRWNYAYQLPGDYIQAYQSYPWANYTEIAQYWEQKAMVQKVSAQNRDSTAQPNEIIKDQRLWSRHFV